MKSFSRYHSSPSFTLVELLVVIGILAILTAAVVIVLNPAELLKQSRDSKRTTDLANLNNALKLLLTQNPDVNLGNASTVYISLADSSSTCGSLGLPALLAGYTYHCVPSASLTLADGSGWLPVSFVSSNTQSLSSLPIDPSNTSSTGLYYTYTLNGAGFFELTASVESGKYVTRGSADGGLSATTFEVGSSLSLIPAQLLGRGATYDQLTFFDPTLAGYWPMDEESGTILIDGSGKGNNGSMKSGGVSAYLGVSADCKKGRCISLGGIDDEVAVPSSQSYKEESVSVSFWVRLNNQSRRHALVTTWHGYTAEVNSDGTFRWGLNGPSLQYFGTRKINWDEWTFLAGTFDAVTKQQCIYFNGILRECQYVTGSILYDEGKLYISGIWDRAKGLMDDVRIYSRALSPTEVQVVYNETK